MKILAIPAFLALFFIFVALYNSNLTLKNENEVLKALQIDYKKQIEKLSDFSDKKQAINKKLQEVKSTFKEQENEELNDNLFDAINFVGSRLCKKAD